MVKNATDEQVVDVTRGILSGKGATEVADECNKIWREQGIDFRVNRQQVYGVLAEAVKRKMLRLVPPLDRELARRIADIYKLDPDQLEVVTARKDLDGVAASAARLARELIEKVAASLRHNRGRKKKEIHIGLGAGQTTALIAKYLADELRETRDLPSLVLHALTTGFDVYQPRKAPLSFFTYFEDIGLDIRFIGLFGPSCATAKGYEDAKQLPGVKESFEAKEPIDLVITSHAGAQHDHGDLKKVMKIDNRNRKSRPVGDVQYCLYNDDGPVRVTSGQRPVTLFELPELRRKAAEKDKYVMLVSGPCGTCNETRTDALEPLIRNPKLKVWSHLVLDTQTARELIERGTDASRSA